LPAARWPALSPGKGRRSSTATSRRASTLEERHDEVHVVGSLDFVQSLLLFGLVDRMNLWLCPLLLSRGKRMFGELSAFR
jgi:dihydrofolate reductase